MERSLLMLLVSAKRSASWLVALALSLPQRSTSSRVAFSFVPRVPDAGTELQRSSTTAWLREDTSLERVAAVLRSWSPKASSSAACGARQRLPQSGAAN